MNMHVDTAAEIAMVLPQHEIKEVGQYRQFEAMRNISRGVCLVDTRYSVLAVALPPFWLIHNRMWAPFGAIMATYSVSIAVHPLFFMLVYVLVSIYFQKAQLQMRFACQFPIIYYANHRTFFLDEICRHFGLKTWLNI